MKVLEFWKLDIDMVGYAGWFCCEILNQGILVLYGWSHIDQMVLVETKKRIGPSKKRFIWNSWALLKHETFMHERNAVSTRIYKSRKALLITASSLTKGVLIRISIAYYLFLGHLYYSSVWPRLKGLQQAARFKVQKEWSSFLMLWTMEEKPGFFPHHILKKVHAVSLNKWFMVLYRCCWKTNSKVV